MPFQSQSIPGYNGVFYVSTDGGTTYIAVGELQDVTLDRKAAMLDATSLSSGGDKNVTPGIREWTATANALAIFADAGQAAIEAAVTPGTRLKIRLDPAGTATGKPRREGFCYIDQLQEKLAQGALVTRSIQITGDGALALSTQ